MFKKALWTLLLPVIMLSLIVCSKLNPYTSAGSDIINTIDPSLTDFNGNFLAYTQDQSMVTDSFVIPTSDQFILKPVKDSLAVGFTDTISRIIRVITGDKDTVRDTLLGLAKNSAATSVDTTFDTLRQVIQAAGNINFNATLQQLKDFKSTDTVIAVTFVFDTLFDTVHYKGAFKDPGSMLNLYSCTKSFQDNPFVQRTAGTTLLGTPIAVTDTADTSLNYQLKITDSSFLATVQKACRSLDTSLNMFYFSLFNNSTAGLLRIKTSSMIISHKHTTSITNDTVVYSSTVGGSMSTIYSKKPRRTSVFEVNLTKFWEAMSTSNLSEILSAAFVIPSKLTFSESDTDSVTTLYYYLSNVPYSADTALDAKIDAAKDRYLLSIPITGRAADSLVLPVDFFLQQMSAEKPPKAYLYLQPYNKKVFWQDISLNKPRFRAVFTTFR